MEEVAADTASGAPMNRLVQGDVGSGKTMVAAYGAWLAAKNGGQCALMAPTELLAEQHFRSLAPLLGRAGVRVGLLTGSVKGRPGRALRRPGGGEVDLVVGTHALLSEGWRFPTWPWRSPTSSTASGWPSARPWPPRPGGRPTCWSCPPPHPRTLALIIYGDLEVSVIDELPRPHAGGDLCGGGGQAAADVSLRAEAGGPGAAGLSGLPRRGGGGGVPRENPAGRASRRLSPMLNTSEARCSSTCGWGWYTVR